MAINEKTKTNAFYRRLIDPATNLWERISFWHKASDCEFDDGMSAETKLGAIKGITASTAIQTTGYAADATVVGKINNNMGGCTFSNEGDGAKTRYFIQMGADETTKKELVGSSGFEFCIREFGNWGYVNITGDKNMVDISSVPNYQNLKLWINIFPACTVYWNNSQNFIATIEYSYDYRNGMVSIKTKDGHAGDAVYMIVHVVTME